VQIKSFTIITWILQAVEDIRRSFEHYPEAGMGLTISTADASTPNLDSVLDRLKEDSGKPVALLIGPDVGRVSFAVRGEAAALNMKYARSRF
jgi:hypothetical protein